MGILDGKAAVVTGGARGIGRGHCIHLAENGSSVVVNDVDRDEARKVVEESAAKGGKATLNGTDIGSREGAKQLSGQCVDECGASDAIVNNAGNVKDRSFLKMTDDEFGDVFRVHVHGTFMCTQEAALRMRSQGTGGAVVNTVSAAHFGNFGQTNYAGSKGAIASMTYTWAVELSRYGIRVNAISPGAIPTPLESEVWGDQLESYEKFLLEHQSLKFRGSAEDVAETLLFLVSDRARFITGQNIVVDGGWWML